MFGPFVDTPLGPLLWYYLENGLDIDFIVEALLGYVLSFSAEIYMFIEMELLSDPYNFASWFSDGIEMEQQLVLIQRFVDTPLCCIHGGISVPVLSASE